MEHDYAYFKKQVFQIIGIDLGAYKESQMKRRIDTLITRHHVENYQKFVERLLCNRELLDEFVNYLTINVSEFYRNPEQWEILEHSILPELYDRFGQELNIWSAACSSGEEPYSLVMALSKHIPIEKVHIVATDIDNQVIEKAKIGVYSAKSVSAVPQDLKEKYFEKIGETYHISAAVKARVEFRQHNLLSDPYPQHMHLIVCRNVLIYFTEDAKSEVFRKFGTAMSRDAILFLGSTEQMLGKQQNHFERVDSFFFRKITNN